MPHAQFEKHREAIELAVRQVLASGNYIHGQAHERFEAAFAEFIGVRNAVGVANGTDALVLALAAYGIGRGDRVLVPSHTASATVSAIRQIGAVPVFLDVDPRTYVITPEIVRIALTPDIKALIAVHLYGNPVDVVALRLEADRAGIVLIEDCAQATGARSGSDRVGSIGHAGCFSFFPTKNLGAVGDGGIVVVDDDVVASRLRRLRMYGWSEERICLEDGFNSRLDELQAAVLAVKLPSLDSDNERRRAIADVYREQLVGVPVELPPDPTNGIHVYHLFVIGVADRAELLRRLRGEGIYAGIHYPSPTHTHPAFRRFSQRPLPHTERLAGRVLSLPIYPELEIKDVERVASVIRVHYGC